MGLGNGGLGRLAACFLDSLATLDLPAIGYGIHYEFGLFKQEFVSGHQIEHPDAWMMFRHALGVIRPEYTTEVQIYGEVENVFNDRGDYRPRWVKTRTILGVPYDIPIVGYGTKTVNLLRLWASKSTEEFDLAAFNSGGYVEAVREKAVGETVSKVLYPNDKTENGKELRLVQQYFFVACSLRDIIRRHVRFPGNSWENFPAKVAVQLNDTHPAVAVPELMRILLDEYDIEWDEAWKITVSTFGYTNHTLLPEALEKWGVPLFARVLPRHLQIIFEINRRLMLELDQRWPGDNEKKRICSLIEEGGAKAIRMANLAVVGAHAVNGVAALHTRFAEDGTCSRSLMRSIRANSRTRPTASRPAAGCSIATPASPGSSPSAWARATGFAISTNCAASRRLPTILDFRRSSWRSSAPTRDLAAVIKAECGVDVSPDALFDVQIKRLHEYKRSTSICCTSWRCTAACSRTPTWRWCRGSSSLPPRRRRATIWPRTSFVRSM
jgi:starch phosphorylase